MLRRPEILDCGGWPWVYLAGLDGGSGYVLGAEAWLHSRCLAWWKIVGKSWGQKRGYT